MLSVIRLAVPVLLGLSATIAAPAQTVARGEDETAVTGSVRMLALPARLSIKDATIQVALTTLQQTSGAPLAFSPSLLPTDVVVTCSCSDRTVGEALNQILAGTGFVYRQVDHQVLVEPAPRPRKREATLLAAVSPSLVGFVARPAPEPVKQEHVVSGRVTSQDDGRPLGGATVLRAGTETGAITDRDGRYSLTVPTAQDTLVFSFIGYLTQTVPVNGRSEINVALAPDAVRIDDIVVIGYGTERRSRITGSVGSVDAQIIERSAAVVSPEQVLQGRIPGVNVIGSSGMPGQGLRVDVRGATSITGSNEPLYVVDGVPISGESTASFNFGVERPSPIAHINPADIESIHVLKDAAATAIYGARASNGVVLITTKRGTSGPTQIEFSTGQGFETVPRRISLVGSDVWFEIAEEARQNFNRDRGLSPGQPGYVAAFADPRQPGHQDTDWFSQVTRQRALVSNYDVRARGGDERTRFYTSASYMTHQGIILTNAFERISGRLNVDHQASDRLELRANVGLSRTVNNRVQNEAEGRGTFTRSLEQRPFDSPFKADGAYNVGGIDIPLHNSVQILNEQDTHLTDYRGLFDATATFSLLPALSYQGKVGGEFGFVHEYVHHNSLHPRGGAGGIVFDWRTLSRNLLLENTLSFDHLLPRNLHVSGLLGHTLQRFESEPSFIQGNDYPSPSFRYITSAASVPGAWTSWTAYAMESIISRANLNYSDRYTLSATLRRDGSSRFAKENRYGWFPSISAAWRLSEEPFLRNSSTLSDLRLRVSYGLTGNQDGIGNFVAVPTATGGQNYRAQTGIAITSVGNPDLTWETASQFNVGVDVGLFEGRLGFSAEYFNQDTDDLLFARPLHATTGFASTVENVGSMSNRGVEFALRTVNLSTPRISWSSEFNISLARNKITGLIGDEPIPFGSHVLQVGQPLGTFYLIRQLGIYQTDDEVPQGLYNLGVRAGDVKFEDTNGDGLITSADRQIVGTANPDFYGGLTNTVRFGAWDLSAFINFTSGNLLYNMWAPTLDGMGHRYPLFSMRTDAVNARWTGPGTSDRVPRPVIGNHNTQASTRFLEDGSFIRLQHVSLGYQLPERIARGIGLNARQVRLAVSARNLLTFTRYSGMDPEVNTSLDPRELGLDRYNVPQMRAVMFNMQVGL